MAPPGGTRKARALFAMSARPTTRPASFTAYATLYVPRHRLPVASTIQAALAALIRQDIITKDGARYVTVDSLYREWVARKTY